MSHAPGTHEAVRRLLGWRDRDARCLDVASGDCPFPFDSTARAEWWNRDKGGPDLDVAPWPSLDGSIRALVAIEVVEHVENPWAFWREIARTLRRDGIAIVTTPNLYAPLARKRIGEGGHAPWFAPADIAEHGHISPILPHLMDEQARRAGLVIAAEDYSEAQLVRAVRAEKR